MNPSTEPIVEGAKEWFVYVIESRSGKFYTGVATDVNRRFRQHAGGLKGGAKFFRSDPPALLLYEESFPDRSSAQKRESQIKSYSRRQKEFLIFNNQES